MLVSRYFRNGLQDNGFGRRGFWTVTVGRGSTDVANALAVDAKGGTLAAGSSTHNCGGTECTGLLLARLGKDGHPVRSFGHSGIVTPPIGPGAAGHPAFETAYEVAARPQGRSSSEGSSAARAEAASSSAATSPTARPTTPSASAAG